MKSSIVRQPALTWGWELTWKEMQSDTKVSLSLKFSRLGVLTSGSA